MSYLPCLRVFCILGEWQCQQFESGCVYLPSHHSRSQWRPVLRAAVRKVPTLRRLGLWKTVCRCLLFITCSQWRPVHRAAVRKVPTLRRLGLWKTVCRCLLFITHSQWRPVLRAAVQRVPTLRRLGLWKTVCRCLLFIRAPPNYLSVRPSVCLSVCLSVKKLKHWP